MYKKNLIKQLIKRNIIKQITDKKKFIIYFKKKKRINLYFGIDPTSDSLHIGHLIPLFCLKHFQLNGHKPYILIGGATSLIGDPSFKIKERKLNKIDSIIYWSKKIKNQILSLLDFNCGKNSAVLINNYKWFSKMNVLKLMKNVGKYISVNKLLNKDFIKQRFINKNKLSYTEFSYNVMQSYDFFFLNKKYKINLQIGGSDQWGNITSGIEFIKKKKKKNVFGLTVPLLIKKNGVKFGKSSKDNIWLDPKKTSPYKFYQFWINIDDDNLFLYLKLFTFIKLKKITLLEKKKKIKNIIKFKIKLAEKITKLIHGKKQLNSVKRITKNLFYNSINKLTKNDFNQLNKDGMPKLKIKKGIMNLMEILFYSKLASSKSKAKNMIKSNSISINGRKEIFIKYNFKDSDILYNKYTILKYGKKNFFLIFWI